MLDDTGRDSDQVVATAVVLEAVEPAQARQTQEIAPWKSAASPVHPGHHHVGPVDLGLTPEDRNRFEVEPTPKRQLDRLDPAPPERHGTSQVLPNYDELIDAGPVQRHRQADEKGLGTTLARAGDDLHDPQRLAIDDHRRRMRLRADDQGGRWIVHQQATPRGPKAGSVMARNL